MLATLVLAMFLQAVPALLSGQSNACLLSPALPPNSHVLVCESGASIARWDWNDPGTSGQTGRNFLAATQTYDYNVVIWWQGESDGAMSAAEYSQRLYTVLSQAAVRPDRVVPVMIVQVANTPSLQHIRAIHAAFAADPQFGPYVALIPTDDLPHDGVHLYDYAPVSDRLVACYQTACWLTQ